MISSLTCSRSPLPQHVERLDQALEVLVRLDVAGVEHERIVELVALAHPRHLLVVGRLAEALVDRVVDDVDLRLGHAEVPQDVALRGFRHRQHAVRPVRRDPQRRARVARSASRFGQVLREAQVDAVVDGHDRSARRQRRQHVVGRVKQVDPLAAQVQRHAKLLADRIRRPTSPRPCGSSRPALRAAPQSSPLQSRTYSVVESMRDRCRSRLRT